MKRIAFIILGISIGLSLMAQKDVSKAFLDSYYHEADTEYSDAILDMEEAYLDDSYSMNLRLGWLYHLDGDYYKSISYYNRAIELESKSIEARLGYIYPLSALQNWEDVLLVYKEIIEIDPMNSSANYQIAYMYYLRNDWINTEKHLLVVLKSYPFDYDSSTLLGSTYIKMGKIKEAKQYYQRALEYNPSSSEIKKILEGL